MRKARGVEAPTDRLPIEPAAAIIGRMRGEGMNWSQIGRVTGLTRDQITEIHGHEYGWVLRATMDRLVEAERGLARVHRVGEVEAVTVDSTIYLWMLDCLAARGWPVVWVKERLGWKYHPANRRGSSRMPVEDARAVEALWREYHFQQGPSRRAALTAWRAGKFPSDCYLWELPIPDMRIIPGSFHPDLVREAATFAPQYPHRAEQVLADMRGWWQWPDAICAQTAMKPWSIRYADQYPISVGGFCKDPEHDHGLPSIWRKR